MEQHGFIQDMLDVKVLILFVMAKLSYPVSLQKIYELCYQDDKLSYFDVSVAVPQMVQSGHLEQLPDETYRITDKGREHEEITCDAIAYPVMQRALTAVQRFNNQMQRKGLTNVRKEESGDFIAELCLRDDAGILMRLELSAPTLSQARGLTRAYEKQADSIYQQMMTLLLGIISLWLTWNIVAPVMASHNLDFWDLAISPFTAALISPKLYILSCLIMIGEWWTLLNLLPIYPLDGGQLIAQYIRSPRKVFMTGFITAILIGLLSFQLFHGYFIPIFMALFAYSNYREYKNAPF